MTSDPVALSQRNDVYNFPGANSAGILVTGYPCDAIPPAAVARASAAYVKGAPPYASPSPTAAKQSTSGVHAPAKAPKPPPIFEESAAKAPDTYLPADEVSPRCDKAPASRS